MCVGCEAFATQRFASYLFNQQIFQQLIEKSDFFGDSFTNYTLQKATELLCKLSAVFRGAFIKPELLTFSEAVFADRSVDSFFWLADKSLLPFSQNWWLLPLKLWYEESSQAPAEVAKAPLSMQFLHSELLFAALLLENLPSQWMEASNRGDILMQVAKCFLLPNHVYEDPVIRQLVDRCLVRLTQEPIVFNESMFTVAKDLVVEYSSTSFGDPLFTEVMLLFLHMQHLSEFRKLVWDELHLVSQLLRPHGPQARAGVHMDRFLYPLETEAGVIQSIVHFLASPPARRNEFLHRIALHHVSACLFPSPVHSHPEDQMEPVLSNWMKKQILSQLSPELIEELQQYSPPE